MRTIGRFRCGYANRRPTHRSARRVLSAAIGIRKDEQRARRAGELLFANPRNRCGRRVAQLDPHWSQSAGGHIHIPLVAEEPVRRRHTRDTRADEGMGLPVESHWTRCAESTHSSLLRRLADKRRSLGFDTAGVVIKVDALERRRRLGTTSNFPGGLSRSSSRRNRNDTPQGDRRQWSAAPER